jgi:DNA uptake protein ComE-like DNA-binding protein
MTDGRGNPTYVWSRTQRGVLIAFVLILASVLLVRLARERMYVSDPPPSRAQRYEELADRIDPNVASWQELAVLPQIGEKRAKEIVAYREGVLTRQPGSVPFARPQDLMNVEGIGPALVQTVRPHLMFPTMQSSMQPTSRGSR